MKNADECAPAEKSALVSTYIAAARAANWSAIAYAKLGEHTNVVLCWARRDAYMVSARKERDQ
jgi:hypothetical protein